MKLRKARHPDPTDSGVYFFTQACHRKTAIEVAIGAIREVCDRATKEARNDELFPGSNAVMGHWAIESLLQGAFLREYHAWETDTKQYFDTQHVRNGGTKVDWKKQDDSCGHVSKVKQQLLRFSASVPEQAMAAINRTRNDVNTIKHNQGTLVVTEDDYNALVDSVGVFWSELASQESVTAQ
jgi:hypothetical protein